MTNKPETVAISEHEGLGWIPWRDVKLRGIDRRVHAIKFADGSSWDAFNGWRHQPKFETIDAEGWAEAAFDKPVMYLPPRVPRGDLGNICRLDNWPWR